MILDTTFLVDLVRGDPGARAFLAQAERGSEAVRVPAPAVAKFWEALERARHAPRDATRVRDVLEAAASVPLGTAEAIRAGRLLAEGARGGAPLDPLDAMVAAVALERGEALVTRNVREYGAIPELRLVPY